MTTRIFDAIQDCLRACYEAERPLACLEQYVSRLGEDVAWAPQDIEEVNQGVRRILGIGTHDRS